MVMDDWGTGTWIAIVIGVWVLARPFSRWAEGRRGRDPAIDELRERYPRGEMGDDEFVERKRRLG
ncbi:MAG: SHOCT domain-containing protein [Geminicoccales bacterium]